MIGILVPGVNLPNLKGLTSIIASMMEVSILQNCSKTFPSRCSIAKYSLTRRLDQEELIGHIYAEKLDPQNLYMAWVNEDLKFLYA